MKKNPDPNGFTGELQQTFEKEMTYTDTSRILKRKDHFSTHEASITLIPKPDKNIPKRNNKTNKSQWTDTP
jgi:hypothetical protein